MQSIAGGDGGGSENMQNVSRGVELGVQNMQNLAKSSSRGSTFIPFFLEYLEKTEYNLFQISSI